jgi:hypothetical protein
MLANRWKAHSGAPAQATRAQTHNHQAYVLRALATACTRAAVPWTHALLPQSCLLPPKPPSLSSHSSIKCSTPERGLSLGFLHHSRPCFFVNYRLVPHPPTTKLQARGLFLVNICTYCFVISRSYVFRVSLLFVVLYIDRVSFLFAVLSLSVSLLFVRQLECLWSFVASSHTGNNHFKIS